MVVIRLSRGGSKKTPFFNLVVADSRNRRDGRFIERVGFYNPSASGQAETLRVDQERVNYWTGVGAQLSDTVKRLVKLHSTGAEGMAKAKAKDEAKAEAAKAKIAAAEAAKVKAAAEAEAEAKAAAEKEAAAAAVEEAPAEEAAAEATEEPKAE
ncbi:MAG: 30S ribosomal protein S16 [Methylophilaceae bacterium]|nr:30S ribosomal protein S16 [Methylophilaceae bacterium]MDG1821590.1 30S ribosomal protein S16 [Methylophilaceae bacterium]MDG2292860.1 30S ribosomal protein S16 [Methylophilaceae bacterium]